ncbi:MULTISPECIES: hypothetical protein [unclassified Streptococcus]|uniref:hypothetical protein n=1 Tax=unclassified Streptococcus TaxID=2608887 RepID=UPI00211AD706|nr:MULTISPECIES: hypothetical protein [unclassified Streptococcus]MCQ9212378.1 hypothetical protein [Streptococcus sp. B01]MCQ9213717.1 hypothetical protein [Streptococcus sp. O1]MCQ9214520.1 hypothetical protein [Streptococcus sp. O1]
METGICRRCGCTWNTACIDEIHGACWWMDKNRTLCSHCFYGLNDESLQMKVYDPEAYVIGLEHAKETKLMLDELLNS